MADHYQIIPKKFNRLIIYGCSDSSGMELADHLALGISFDECNHLKKQAGSIEKFENTYLNGKKIHDLLLDYDTDQVEKNLSYGSSLAKKLNLICDNRAIAGNSQSQMYWELTKDFYQGRINDNDLVLIGCTLIERVMLMEKDQNKTLTTTSFTMPRALEVNVKVFDACNVLYSLDKWIWQYYNILESVETFASKNNINLIMVPTSSLHTNILHPQGWIYENYNIDPIIKKHAVCIWKKLRETIMITDQGIDFETKVGLAGWTHYPQVNHDQYAEHLYQQLKLFRNFI